MTYQIDIQTEIEAPEGIDEILETAVLVTLERHVAPASALTLLLTDDTHMQRLNRDFRGIDKTTDVLSFPAGDPLPEARETIPYLGDIAISLPVAKIQAQTIGHTLIAELQLLAIHGVLHLLGYDHAQPDGKARMWSTQEQILDFLGLQDIKPTEA